MILMDLFCDVSKHAVAYCLCLHLAGTLNRDKDAVLRFGLSPEEVGLILHQIPNQQPVELARKPTSSEALFDSSSMPHKVCKIIPNPDLASVSWTIDFELDGVGGQVLQNSQGPLTVEMQAGEVQVTLEIMRQTIPVLVGWNTMQDIALQKMLGDTMSSPGRAPPQSSDY
jgi:hypothetical protein